MKISHPSARNIPYLDGWRGLAIVLVLLGHFGGHRGWLGTFGVHLFFVLSGLLMGQLLFLKQVRLSDFFVRRFSRVFPTFLLYLLVIVVYAQFFQPNAYHASFKEVLATLTFLRTYLPGDTTIWTREWPIGHFWSLNVEEHSYLFLAVGAFLCGCTGKKSARVYFLLASAGAILLLNFIYRAHPPQGTSPWYLRSECASLGLISAAALNTARNELNFRWLKRVPSLLPVFSFAIAVICVSTYAYKDLDKMLAPILLALSVVYLDHAPGIFRSGLSSPVLRWFGTRSFSLYLWQQPFFLATLNYGTSPFLAGVLAIAFGSLSFYYFEAPLRQFINRAWHKRREGSWQTQVVDSSTL